MSKKRKGNKIMKTKQLNNAENTDNFGNTYRIDGTGAQTAVYGNSPANKSRFAILKEEIDDYMEIRESIKTGIEDYDRIKQQKKKIKKYLGATEAEWNDYSWQLKNRFTNPEELASVISMNKLEINAVKTVAAKYRFAVSPYYLSLINPDDPDCPVRRQSIPSSAEMDESGELDPMDEKGSAIEEIITRRYPDRLIIKVTNICGMFCRFCQRRRLIGEFDTNCTEEKLRKAIAYVRRNPEIRDVLITGGDAFMLPDSQIDWLLSELRRISHVEIIRFGTRTPATLPQRVTKNLASILKKYHPIYVNTHFNSPMEVTPEAKAACATLADAGIPLGNQMVLLNGVNNDPYIVRKLNQALLTIRVRPYYIFHPKTIKGTKHFWASIEEGMEIMESLRGRTSGLAIPAYIINGPKGLGKTPILPNYLLYAGRDKAVFRNWQGIKFEVPNEISTK
ncbi:MAG: KamA family radical SAM protein [Eubacteriales bacterium]|nr:KamA family radical SAM protein [Eubacteriales bacterium]